jgi:hypothetical protein
MSSRSHEKKWRINNRLAVNMILAMKALTLATSGCSGPKAFSVIPSKGLSIRVLAFGTVKFRQVAKAW